MSSVASFFPARVNLADGRAPACRLPPRANEVARASENPIIPKKLSRKKIFFVCSLTSIFIGSMSAAAPVGGGDMESTVDEAIQRAKAIYEMVAGHSAPEFSSDIPYARIPPEVDREEHVLRQAAALFQKVSDVVSQPVQTAQARGVMPVPVSTYRDGNDLRFVFDVGNTPRESVTVELRGPELRVSSERGEQQNAHTQRIVQTAFLPARVDPGAVSAELSDGF